MAHLWYLLIMVFHFIPSGIKHIAFGGIPPSFCVTWKILPNRCQRAKQMLSLTWVRARGYLVKSLNRLNALAGVFECWAHDTLSDVQVSFFLQRCNPNKIFLLWKHSELSLILFSSSLFLLISKPGFRVFGWLVLDLWLFPLSCPPPNS